MKLSPLLIPTVCHLEVFEMKGEFQVKGRKRDTFINFFLLPLSLDFLSLKFK